MWLDINPLRGWCAVAGAIPPLALTQSFPKPGKESLAKRLPFSKRDIEGFQDALKAILQSKAAKYDSPKGSCSLITDP